MDNFVTEVDIEDESKECFLTFCEEVLTDRAVPNAEDGLLSVHRKLIWTMEEILKMNSKSKFKKSASVVGSTIASSYFHGDIACYGALCKLVQPYLMRYPLVDGDGNLGSQEANGMEAAARYTNVKPSKFADLMMNNFKKNIVPLKETYNGEYMEPVILPSILPNALVNGRESIAVGLSHNSLPNNLSEVCDGIIEFIKNNDIAIDELMNYIKGPDFPLGGVVINKNDIKYAFETGHSNVSLKVRGDYEIEGNKIIFNTIPYRTYRNKIKEQITKNADKLEEIIDDFSDESNVGKNKLVFIVKDGINPNDAVLKLFALTDLQTTLSYNMNFIVDGTPKMCTLIDLIESYVNHQNNLMIKSAEYDKDKAEKRIHILNGLIIAVDKIDEVIRLIKSSKDKKEAQINLIDFLSIDEIQANAILEMKLGKLTKIDKEELIKELEQKKTIVAECNKIINEQQYRDEKLISLLLELKNKYGDKRRTILMQIDTTKEKGKEEIVPEDVVVILSKNGNIKRVPKKSFRVEKKRSKGTNTKGEEIVLSTIKTNTADSLLLFTSIGKMYKILVNDIPIGATNKKGINVKTLIKVSPEEEIVAATAYTPECEKYVVFITENGQVKKTKIEEYVNVKRQTGIIAIKIKDEDKLINVIFTNDEDIIILTKNGRAIRFSLEDISSVGRAAMGVKSIKLEGKDKVIAGIPILNEYTNLTLFTSLGYAKKVDLDDFPIQIRGGKGLSSFKLTEATGSLIGGILLDKNDNVVLFGRPKTLCVPAEEIPKMGRRTSGSQIVKSNIESIAKI